MTKDGLEQAIAAANQRLENLLQRAAQIEGQSGANNCLEFLQEAIAQVSASLEELQVMAEELEVENEDLIKTRQAVEMERQLYRDFFNFASDGYFVTDRAGIIQEANEAAAQLLNINPIYLIGKPLAVFVHPTNRPRFSQLLMELQQEGQIRGEELLIFHPRRKVDFPAQVTAVAVSEGKQGSWRWLLRDIRERKQLELALQTSETKLNDVLNSTMASIVRFRVFANRDWEFDYYSTGCQRLFGYTPQELMTDKTLWLSRVLPEDREKVVLPSFEKIFAEESFRFEYRFCHQDGSLRWISASFTSQRDAAADCWIVTGLDIDISDRKQLELALQHSQAKLNDVFNSAIAAIASFRYFPNHNWEYECFSAGAEAVFGYTVEEFMTDKYIWRLGVLPEVLETVLMTLYEGIVAERTTTVEYPFRHKDGSIRWICTTYASRWDEVAQCWYVTGVSTDISDRKQLELALQQAKEAAEAANFAKSTFLANMSHELRTPLNAILGFTQVMSRDRSISPQHQESLGIINSAGEHLLNLINDILEVSKIEAGKTELNVANFDLIHLLSILKQILQLKAEDKGLKLTFDIAEDVPQSVQTDEGKLRQVLLNLLGNAIKFTQKGEVILRVRLGEGDGQNLRVLQSAQPASAFPIPGRFLTITFEVEDTGPGINAEEIHRLFKPFSQTETGRKAMQGTGLGLTISRKFVQMMGGDIRVKTNPGQGSIFAFDIWVNSGDSSNSQITEHSRQVISLAPNQSSDRILVVDDHPESCLMLVKLLTSIGFQIRQASNGRDAVEIWSSWQPHLICMDMRMPMMDGYEATRQIKATPQGQATVIIALTANAFEEDKKRVFLAGCDDFISKPLQQNILLDKIRKHLNIVYIYEQESERHKQNNFPINNTLTLIEVQKKLDKIPPDWLLELHDAAYICNDDIIFYIIDQIKAEDPLLANYLYDLTYNFQFEKLIKLLKKPER